MTLRYQRMVGEKSVTPNRNSHLSDRGSRLYLCRCFKQIKLPNGYLPKMRNQYGRKRPYRSEFKIRY